MGLDQSRNGVWGEIKRLADKLDSPHADKTLVAQEYAKADMRRDLLATLPDGWERVDAVPEWAAKPAVEITPEKLAELMGFFGRPEKA